MLLTNLRPEWIWNLTWVYVGWCGWSALSAVSFTTSCMYSSALSWPFNCLSYGSYISSYPIFLCFLSKYLELWQKIDLCPFVSNSCSNTKVMIVLTYTTLPHPHLHKSFIACDRCINRGVKTWHFLFFKNRSLDLYRILVFGMTIDHNIWIWDNWMLLGCKTWLKQNSTNDIIWHKRKHEIDFYVPVSLSVFNKMNT